MIEGAIAAQEHARDPLAPQTFDRVLAFGAAALMLAVLSAIARGHDEWHEVSPVVWSHIGTILIGLGLTPVMLLRRRGDSPHRALGWVWCSAMFVTALISLFVRGINPGHFSLIHLLSIWTMIQVPLIILNARRHDWPRHRSAVRGMITGALLIAGFFTFPFNRLLGSWLFG